MPLSPLNSVPGATGAVGKVFAIGDNLAFACSGNLIASTDSGATFRSYMNGLTASRVLSLADNGQRKIFAGTSFSLFHHADTSASWSYLSLGGHDGIFPISSLATNQEGLIVAGSEPGPSMYQKITCWCSTDLGASWTGPASGTWPSSFGGRTKALAASPWRLQWFGTIDGGVWRGEPYPGGGTQLLNTNAQLMSITFRNSAELYAGSALGTVYCSYDTGMTWTSTQLVPTGAVQSLALGSGGRVYAGTSVGFFASSDRGSSWVQRGGGEVPSNIRVLVTKPGTGIYAGTPDGVYHSSDEGEHWQALNEGLASREIYSLCFGSDGALYAGTSGGGVFRLPLEVTAVHDKSDERPSAYALHQNYPNPFNPTTAIKFQVPKASAVKILVYDLLGREVAVVVNEMKQPGAYTVEFRGAALASGVYIYRMTGGSFVASRKMIIMK